MATSPISERVDVMGRPLPPIRKRPTLTITPEIEARFWSKVDRSPGQGPNGECWCWTGALDDSNYPKGLTIKIDGESYRFRAAQIALYVDGKPQPAPEFGALHSCDHPPCVRPDHVRWGTGLDNVKDAIARRKHGRTFTPDEVKAIRASSDRQADIAREYGTSSSCISNIRNRITHRHVK